MRGVNLTRRLTLEEAVRLPDGMGGYVESWVARGVLWADVRPGAGRRIEDERAPRASVPCRILVRGAPVGAPSRPRPGQRFREGPRIFHIRAVAEADRRGSYLTCFAEEEGPA